jgi:hypothetical protein
MEYNIAMDQIAYNFHVNRLKQLIGAKITKIIVDPSGFSDGEFYTGFIVEKGKKKWEIISQSDAEGNDAGWIDITEIDDMKPPKPLRE